MAGGGGVARKSSKKVGDEFEERLYDHLKAITQGTAHQVERGVPLRYSGRVDPWSGALSESHTDYAVDLVITTEALQTIGRTKEKGGEQLIPLVALEAKTTGTTDQLLAATKKAEDIRRSYPWIRFGLVTNEKGLPGKSLWHGRAFDFILAIGGLSDDDVRSVLARVILRELDFAVAGITIPLGRGHRYHREYPPYAGTQPDKSGQVTKS